MESYNNIIMSSILMTGIAISIITYSLLFQNETKLVCQPDQGHDRTNNICFFKVSK